MTGSATITPEAARLGSIRPKVRSAHAGQTLELELAAETVSGTADMLGA